MTLHLGEKIISFCQTWPGIFRNNVITVQYKYIQKLLYSHLLSNKTEILWCICAISWWYFLGKNLFWEVEGGGC